MVTFLDHLRVQTKLWILVVFFLASLGVLAGGRLLGDRALALRYQEAMARAETQRLALSHSREAQVHFKIQVQEWKDFLLRGSDPARADLHLKAMLAEAGLAERALEDLEPEVAAAAPAFTPQVREARRQLNAVTQAYLLALDGASLDTLAGIQALDLKVRGIDRPPHQVLDRMVDGLTAQGILSAREDVAALKHSIAHTAVKMTLATVLAAGAGLLLSMTIILRLQEALLKLLAGQQALLEGAMDTRVEVGGRDEIAALGVSFNRMAEGIQGTHESLRAAKEQAEAASRMKSSFVASMSHELRTPLNAILGYAQLIETSPGLDEENRQDASKIHRAGDHLLDLINDILSISKIEAHKLELGHVAFRLGDLLNQVEEIIGPRAEAKGLRFEFAPHPALPDVVTGDPMRIRQVLLNLLGNAVKFTQAGYVRLEVGVDGGVAMFRISDSGPGVEPEASGRLFQPFEQGTAGRKLLEGAGLGLSISFQIVEMMGGTLSLESRPGEGATFLAQFPLPSQEAPFFILPTLKPKRVPPGLKPPRLLVVDDRRDNVELLERLFIRAGIQVACAYSGEEGLALWEKTRPDALWLDIRMPGMDGYQTLAALRAREAALGWPRTPVGAITASVMDQDEDEFRRRGFDAFLGKPFREEDLLHRTALLLGIQLLDA